MTSDPSLLSEMLPPRDGDAVIPDHPPIEGPPDCIYRIDDNSGFWLARIELHRHTDGRWMWAVSYFTPRKSMSVAVNPGRGNFTATREAAYHYAASDLREEMETLIEAGCDGDAVRRILAWAGDL